MKRPMTRRDFLGLLGAGTTAMMVPGSFGCRPTGSRFGIGYTFITWGYRSDVLEEAVKHISALGYHSFETFGWVIEQWEKERGGIGTLIDTYGIPIQSAFCMLDVLDPDKIAEEADRLAGQAALLKKYGGEVIVFTGRGKRDETYTYMDHRDTIVKATNTYAGRVADQGLAFAYHQHTGTPVETREELYDLVERVDTEIVKLGPDIGQLRKGGSDPVKVMEDFLPLIRHVHLKDYAGGDPWVGYAPLGQGMVDIPAVLDLLEKGDFSGSVMAELDPGKDPPVPPEEAARISRDYLEKLGHSFRTNDQP